MGLFKFTRFFRGVVYLSAVQYFTYIIPIILIPVIIDALGKSEFGEIIFAQVAIALIGLLVNYGFDISGVRDSSIIRENVDKINLIYSEIFYVRLSLFITLFFPVVSLLYVFKSIFDDTVLFILFYFNLIEFLINPRWLFQGLEKMKEIAIITVVTKMVAFFFIVVMLQFWKSSWVIPLGYFFGNLIGIIPVFIFLKSSRVRLLRLSQRRVISRYKSGWSVFVATISVGVYMNASTFIVGLYLPAESVGLYGIVEKVIRAVQNFLKPVADVVYPIFSEKSAALNSHYASLKILKRILLSYSVLLISAMIGFILCSELIFEFLYGEVNLTLRTICMVMIFAVFFGPINFVLGNIGLMNMGETKYYSNAVVVASVLSIPVSLFLIIKFDLLGASYAFLIAEILLFLMLSRRVFKLCTV